MPSASVRELGQLQRAKFRDVHRRLVALTRSRDENQWEIGTQLSVLSREQLWLSGGYPTFNAYVEQALGLSKSQAHALRRVSRFPRAVVEKYGWVKLDLVARLWELLPGVEDYAKVADARFRVPTDAGVESRALSEMSKRDLEAALDLAGDDVVAPRTSATARRFVSVLEQALGAVPGVRVRASGTATSPRFAVLGLPLSEAARLRDALTTALGKQAMVARPSAGGAARRLVSRTNKRRAPARR